MKFNRRAQFNRRPFNAPAQLITLPTVDLTVQGTVSVSMEEYLPSTLRLGFEVSGDLSQPFLTAKVPYTKAATGGVSSTIWFMTQELIAADHLGVNHCLAVVIYPSQTATIAPGGDAEVFTGYDHGWYLSENPLDDDQLSLLAPDKQDTAVYQRLDFDYTVANFTVGKIIKGATSLATATIVGTRQMWIYGPSGEMYYVPESSIVIKNIDGTFVDDETIKEIGGSGEALVNGALVPLDFGPGTIYPEDLIRSLLGGDKWAAVTGIYPYRINPTVPVAAGSWTAQPYVSWTFSGDAKKRDALDQMAEYDNFVTLVKFKQILGTAYTPCFYRVHMDDIDNPDDYALTEHRGLSLPAAVTVTADDDYLVGRVEIDINGASKRNKVRVRCQGLDGVYCENVQVMDDGTGTSGTATCSAGVWYGEEKPLVYLETNQALFTQAQAQLRAALLYQYLSLKICTYKATFAKRLDFERYQILTLSGHSATHVPDGDYRIIGIKYRKYPANVFVDVTLIPVDQFAAQVKINRVYTNSRLEMERVIKREQAKTKKSVVKVGLAIDGDEITGRTEDGHEGVTRMVS